MLRIAAIKQQYLNETTYQRYQNEIALSIIETVRGVAYIFYVSIDDSCGKNSIFCAILITLTAVLLRILIAVKQFTPRYYACLPWLAVKTTEVHF